MFNNLFNKSSSQQSELKSHSYSVGQCLDVYNNYASVFNLNQVSLSKFLNDYLLSPPVNTALKLITDNLANIDPIVKDVKKDENMQDHPLANLINKKPNPFEDSFLFKQALSNFYLLTGNSYVNVIGGDGRRPPVELQSLNPGDITVQSSDNSGFPTLYQYNANHIGIIYKYDPVLQKFLAENGNELLVIRTFNPKFNSSNLTGLSPLQSIQLEIEQYLHSNIHNLSVLKNQGRPSAIVSTDNKESGQELSNEQIDDIQERLLKMKGSQNAGRISFLPFNLKWQAVSESIKDMDFEGLRATTEQAIYKAFKIPLSYATEEASTMNNKEIARLDLYDNAIIPLGNRIWKFIGEKLLPRYPNGENLELIIDKSKISVFLNKTVKETKDKKDLGALSINELRAEIGKESIGAEGDIIYQPGNLVPVGVDQFTDDNRDKPSKEKDIADLLTEKHGSKLSSKLSIVLNEEIKNHYILKEKAYFRKMLIDQGYEKDYIDKCLREHYG